MQSGKYESKTAVATLSNAMDVGNPSNFIRILELFNHQYPALKNVLTSYSISDEETKAAIKEVYHTYQYLLDPHGAVAYTALEKYLAANPLEKGIILETAHPVKFYDVVEPVIEQKVSVPDSILSILNKKKISVKMESDYEELKTFLMDRSSGGSRFKG